MAAVAATPATIGRGRHIALAAYWFGLYFLFTPVGTSLVPAQIGDLVPEGRQLIAQGLLLGCGAFFAMVVPPVVGAWSDRLHSRWGRRRPILVAGTAGSALMLLVMMGAHSYPQLLLGYALLQAFSNGAGAAYSALIPDVVPPQEFGAASGWLSTMVLVGSGGGLAANVLLAALHHRQLTYLVIVVVVLLTLIPTLRAARGEESASAPSPEPPGPWRSRLRAAVAPLQGGDFAWVFLTRLMITAGISSVSPFTFFFFRDVVKVGNPDVFNPVWLLVVLAFAAPLGYAGGRLSDRLGRKPFVYWSGALQAAVVVLFIIVYPRQVPLVLALGAAYGVGYGMYTSVDWALACDTLPDRARSAKDMGLFHVAFVLPSNVVPALAGLVLGAVNARASDQGYRVVFGAAAIFFVLGTVLVRRIRSVR